VTDDLKAIDRPTLVVHSDDDQIVPVEASAKRAVDFIKDAELNIYALLGFELSDTTDEIRPAACLHRY
jgi:non-heme chloroperoxidase